MAKKDIFKIDNYMITIGIIILLVGLVTTFADPRTYFDLEINRGGGSFSYDNFDGRSLEEIQKGLEPGEEISEMRPPIIRPIIAVSGLCLLIVGIVFRKKENKIISIWDALEKTSFGKVRELEVNLGLSRDFICSNLKHINAQQGTYYLYRSDNDTIIDGRLAEEHVISVSCSGCGHKINNKVSLANLKGLSCSYCGAAVQTEELKTIRDSIVEENRVSQDSVQQKSFNLPIFLMLLVLFWPAAIIYLVANRKAVARQSMEVVNQFSLDKLPDMMEDFEEKMNSKQEHQEDKK